jgi:hypothetical protein
MDLMEKSTSAFVNTIKHFVVFADERNVARLILARNSLNSRRDRWFIGLPRTYLNSVGPYSILLHDALELCGMDLR